VRQRRLAPFHPGRDSGLVDEEEALRVEVRLGFEPGEALFRLRHRGPVLPHARSFFARQLVALNEAADPAVAERFTLLSISDHKINRIDELLPWNWTSA
jgi:hypothetical protein